RLGSNLPPVFVQEGTGSSRRGGGPWRAPTRCWLSGGPEVAARIQEPVVLRRPAVCWPCRPLTDADVERGLEAVEPVEGPDAARRVDRPGAGSAVADARRAGA